MENDALRELQHMKPHETGILVRGVSPETPASKVSSSSSSSRNSCKWRMSGCFAVVESSLEHFSVDNFLLVLLIAHRTETEWRVG